MESIIDLLGLGDVEFIELERGMNGYPHCLHFGGISICYGGREDMGISTKGLTCGFGSEKSDIYIRIYDKKAEQKREDLDHWVRCEIQLRRENAIGFIMLAGDICTNYFGVLNNYLRFIEPSETDSNKRRAKTAEWWAKFLETGERLKIFQAPGVEYDVMCLDGYVYGQCAGAVSTMIELVGLSEFMERLNYSVITRKRNPKYKDLLNRFFSDPDNFPNSYSLDDDFAYFFVK